MNSLTVRVAAQHTRALSPTVKTVRLVVGNDLKNPPVVYLDSHTPINISFDDISDEMVRYVYRVVHCDADWVRSNLLPSEYCEGFSEGIVESWQMSINTTVGYSHYDLTFPNEQTCAFLASGNYKVQIVNEDSDEIVAEASFLIAEPIAVLTAEVSGSTDIDTNKEHQQVSFSMNLGRLSVNNPHSELRTFVCQNRHYDVVRCVTPSYVFGNQYRYEHLKDLIFKAKNEFRKFELLSVRSANMGVESMGYEVPFYRAELVSEYPRRNYVYDEDLNGGYLVRTLDSTDPSDISADYVSVRFTLPMEKVSEDLYVSGMFCNWQRSPEYLMSYDEITKCYVAEILLKQGYYEYSYVIDMDGEEKNVDGDFSQTENEYTILVYYRAIGGRADRLVGYGIVKS